MLHQVLSDGEIDLVVSAEKLQHVCELSYSVAFLDNDLLGPVD